MLQLSREDIVFKVEFHSNSRLESAPPAKPNITDNICYCFWPKQIKVLETVKAPATKRSTEVSSLSLRLFNLDSSLDSGPALPTNFPMCKKHQI